MHIIECDRCKNAFRAKPELAGATVSCPICDAGIYVPQTPDGSFVSCGKIPRDEDLVIRPKVVVPPDAQPEEQLPVEAQGKFPYLVAVGWVALFLAVCMLLLSTPATYILWLVLNITAIAVSIAIARTNLRAGLPLLVACVVIPATISVIFWVQTRREAEKLAAEFQSDIDKLNKQMVADIEASKEKLNQLFRTPVPHSPLQQQKAAPRPRVANSLPPPASPVANWSAAKSQFRVGGTVIENGETFALINGSLRRHGETVQTSIGPFTYYFRVRIQDKSAEITPIRSVRK